ncbi:hypothetical protein ACHAXT_001323 [Thalassiosira profunda]
MSGRKRHPRGAAEAPPTRNTDAANRGEGEEADYAHFEAMWHKNLSKCSDDDDSDKGEAEEPLNGEDWTCGCGNVVPGRSKRCGKCWKWKGGKMKGEKEAARSTSEKDPEFAASNGRRGKGPQRKRRRAPPQAGRENDTKTKGGGKEGERAGASAKGRNLCSPRDRWSQPLYQHWSIPQIDDLVGWATSHRGTDKTSRPASDSIDGDEGRRLGLAHLLMSPPPPSHMAFLRHRIKERRGENPPGGGKGKRKRNKTATGGLGIDGLESMSTSAHVATGMAVEEALTMALMPLAEAHVARCRRLQRGKRTTGSRKEGRPSTRRRDDDPFHAWTLPPAEAIAALAREGSAEGRTALTSLLGKHPDVVAKHASPTVAKEVAPKMEEDSSDGSGSSGSSEVGDSESEEEDPEELASKEGASSDGSESENEDKTPAADSSDSDGEEKDSDGSVSGSGSVKSSAAEDASSDNSDGSDSRDSGSEDSEGESENAQRY